MNGRMNLMNQNSRIYVAGHQGLVGSALIRLLEDRGFSHLVTATFNELDLRNQKMTHDFFAIEKPEYVFLAAAKVGGIKANNDFPADFIYDNLMIEANVIHAAFKFDVKKLLFLGSSCIYPKLCLQPIKEEYLLTGSLEPTNAPYAIAKIAGISLAQSYARQYGSNFICAMPTNLYGPGDTFDENNSHVIPALIKKIHEAHTVGLPNISLWGTGNALREFLYVDDCADALLMLMQNYDQTEPINLGSGQEVTIKEVALLIKEIVGYNGTIHFDAQHPDGTPRKLLDCSKLNSLNWSARTQLKNGLEKTYEWYRAHESFIQKKNNSERISVY